MTGTGMELELLFKGVKYLGICFFVWFIEPILGFFVIQVDAVGILNEHQRALLDDYKIILAVLVPSLLAIKYIIDIYKARNNKKK